MTSDGMDPSDLTSDREVPEGQERKDIKIYDTIHQYISQRADANERTFSQEVDSWLPEDYESVLFEVQDADIHRLRATPQLHAKLISMCGSRVSPNDVIALYAFVDAIERGDDEAVADLVEHVPTTLWNAIGQGMDLRGEFDVGV